MVRKIKIIALILLILNTFWVILTAISISGIDPSWNDLEYVEWIADPGVLVTVNYINVTLLTVMVVVLFTYLFKYAKDQYRTTALAGLIFIPVYGIINIFSYSIQISIVPSMARTALENQEDVIRVSKFIQANSNSLIGLLNGLAYAILGIPSILFGIILFRKSMKRSAIFLFSNGIFCMTGFMGYLLNQPLISLGTMIGGILFLISLIFMVAEFKSGSG